MARCKTKKNLIDSFLRFDIVLILAFVLVVSSSVQGQNEKAAANFFDGGNYIESIKAYSKLIEANPENGQFQYRLGISYLRTTIDPLQALEHLIAAEKLGEKEKDLSLEIAHAYMYHLEYEEALARFEKLRDEGKVSKKSVDGLERNMANARVAQDLVKYPLEVDFRNLGEEINSSYPEYHPFISADGNRLVFTSRRKVRPGSKPEFDGHYPSDIYSAKKKNNAWDEADRVNDRINTIYDEQSVGLSPSGDTLFYYIDHVDDFGDLYAAVNKGGIFTNPQRLAAHVNSPQLESACSLSHDGRTMVFSSNRPGGAGQMDIWICHKDEAENWSEAKSVGDIVNTTGNEDYPSLSSDGQVLYFCSEGHPGMGGYDLFFSSFDTVNQHWTKPQNMGYPINSPGDELTISFEKGSAKGVIAALRAEGFGDLDIYEFSYKASPFEDEPAIFHLQISAESKTLSDVSLTIYDAFDTPIGNYKPNSITGRFTFALTPGTYYIYADADGYKPHTEVWVVNDAHLRQINNVKFINLQNK